MKVQLEKEQETLLITLQAKAKDARAKRSILNDTKAQEILSSIDYDFARIEQFGNEIMVMRAKQFDDWLQFFIKENPQVHVLNLGCGLDTRVARIDSPSTVQWFDVDFPEVITLRKHFFSVHESYEMIASSVTNSGWIEQFPNDKPAFIIAEGLLEYLSEIEVKKLLSRLTNHFPHGRITFDVMNAFAINAGKKQLKTTTGAEHRWIVDDINQVDRLNETLQRVAALSIFETKSMHQLPLNKRLIYSMMRKNTNFKNMMQLLMYEF